jgi:hypothetical protein
MQCSFLDVIKTLTNEVFKDFVTYHAVEIRKLRNLTRQTAESNNIAKQTPGSEIFTLQLPGKIHISMTLYAYL